MKVAERATKLAEYLKMKKRLSKLADKVAALGAEIKDEAIKRGEPGPTGSLRLTVGDLQAVAVRVVRLKTCDEEVFLFEEETGVVVTKKVPDTTALKRLRKEGVLGDAEWERLAREEVGYSLRVGAMA